MATTMVECPGGGWGAVRSHPAVRLREVCQADSSVPSVLPMAEGKWSS